MSGNCGAGLAWSQCHLCVKAAAPKRVSGKMKVMLQRAEDALFLSSRTFATKSANTGREQVQQNLLMMLCRSLSCVGGISSHRFLWNIDNSWQSNREG